MEKFILVSFIEPVENPRFEIENWPLHLTFVPSFAVDATVDELEQAIETVTQSTPPVKAIAQADAFFGPENDILVSPLEPRITLLGIHKALLAGLVTLSPTFDHPEYMGQAYQPHITAQQHKRVQPNETVPITSISLVQKYPHGNRRERLVLNTHTFTG